MEYISTRGSRVGSFEEVLMEGLAQDGGLFIPNEWPKINTNDFKDDLRFKTIHISEIFITENEKGLVDSLTRRFNIQNCNF